MTHEALEKRLERTANRNHGYAMAKLCVDCIHLRKGEPLLMGGGVGPSLCAATHNHVVGDGIESGALPTECWQERTVQKPGESAFHCGPEARFFQPKPGEDAK